MQGLDNSAIRSLLRWNDGKHGLLSATRVEASNQFSLGVLLEDPLKAGKPSPVHGRVLVLGSQGHTFASVPESKAASTRNAAYCKIRFYCGLSPFVHCPRQFTLGTFGSVEGSGPRSKGKHRAAIEFLGREVNIS